MVQDRQRIVGLVLIKYFFQKIMGEQYEVPVPNHELLRKLKELADSIRNAEPEKDEMIAVIENKIKNEKAGEFITFEEFIFRCIKWSQYPTYNNFFCFFYPGKQGDRYREKDFYSKFARENSEMIDKLYSKMLEIDNRREQEEKQGREKSGIGELLKPIEADLYEAYKIMRRYGASSENLFS